MAAMEHGTFVLDIGKTPQTGLAQPAITEPSTEWVDDYLINLETGEILGTRQDQEAEDTAEPFRVNSIEAAEWVLDRMARREAALVALNKRLSAVISNFNLMISAEQRRLGGLHYRFDADLESFARAELAAQGSRSKTLRTAFGSVSFRVVRASRKIVDMAAAVRFAKRWAPSTVRIKEDVLLAELEEHCADWPDRISGQTASEALAEVEWIETRLEEERAYIRTGVED